LFAQGRCGGEVVLLSERFGCEPTGATPLSEDDYRELILQQLPDRNALNFAEATNILKAQTKHLERKVRPEVVLDDLFVRTLHREMFGEVWQWAGKYRTRDLSLGVEFTLVAESVRALMDNAKLWVDDNALDSDTLACQLHHQLVLIHPFVNGNGRLSRLMSDILLTSMGSEPFTWGASSLGGNSQARDAYIKSLKIADNGHLGPLLHFARS